VLNCFAAIHPGLEPALVDELTDLGARATARPGGASFQADLELLYDVHLYSRLAGRVTVELGTGGAINLEALYNVVRSRNFKPYVWPGQPIEVKATTRRSHLKNRAAVEKKAELAIKDGLRGPRLPGPRPPREPARILVSVDDDSARVSVDASGELLHKRGWRKITAKAPIRENLAAAMLRIAEWVPGTPLVDPMCGSGTFPIEAATIAMGRAPGLDRDPDLLRWPSADHRLWERLHHAARDLDVLDKKAVIWASDRDPGAIKATTENARRAGVGDRIRVQQIAFEASGAAGVVGPRRDEPAVRRAHRDRRRSLRWVRAGVAGAVGRLDGGPRGAPRRQTFFAWDRLGGEGHVLERGHPGRGARRADRGHEDPVTAPRLVVG
jgi:putative N6-adenine-specific DNA methylase